MRFFKFLRQQICPMFPVWDHWGTWKYYLICQTDSVNDISILPHLQEKTGWHRRDYLQWGFLLNSFYDSLSTVIKKNEPKIYIVVKRHNIIYLTGTWAICFIWRHGTVASFHIYNGSHTCNLQLLDYAPCNSEGTIIKH